MRLIIAERRDEADGVISLSLEPTDGGRLPAWTPGAHVDLRLDDGLIRQYSLCSEPDDRGRWRLGILREPESRGGSQRIFDKLHGGDIVEVGMPRNHFELRSAPSYVFIAGGIGITPILPMIAHVNGAGARWTLLYCGRSRRSMAFTGELARYRDRVAIAPRDEVGRPDLAAVLGTPAAETLVYACGPAPLLDAIATRMRDWPAGSLHTERFAPPVPASAGSAGPFQVEFQASGITATVPADRSILAVAEEAGIVADWSCREGTCGTCEASVLGGRVDHRDSVLTEAERDTQDCLMICVSRAEPGCPLLRLDL